MSLLRDQRGNADTIVMVSALAILVIIATVVAIINVGRNPFIINPTPTPSATAAASPSVSAAASPSTSPSVHTPGQALTQVKDLYAAYSANPTASVRNRYITADLAANVSANQRTSGYDGLFCSVARPTGFSYDPPTNAGSTSVVTVHETFATAPAVELEATVRLSDLLVSLIDCP